MRHRRPSSSSIRSSANRNTHSKCHGRLSRVHNPIASNPLEYGPIYETSLEKQPSKVKEADT